MPPQLGNRSSSFSPIYPSNATTGILQVETVSTVDNVLLATYRATTAGTGYAIGDIIFYRQIGTDPAQYYNGDTVVTPNPNHLGPLSIATNVIVTSTPLPTEAATSTLQTTNNTILTDIVNTLPTTGTAGVPSTDIISVQGVTGGQPLTIVGSVTSSLSANDTALLTDIKNRLVAVDDKLVSGNPIGAVQVTNGIGLDSVNIKDGGNSITVDGSVDLIGSSATNLANVNNKLPAGLVVTNNRLVVDNTQQIQPISGTVIANTGLAQPLTNAELRNTPVVVQLNNAQLNSLIPPANATNLATETTLANVLTAVQGNVNFNESIWTDDTGTYFARRVTQTPSGVAVNYYLADGSGYTPGVNPRPVLTDSNKELVFTYYEALINNTGFYNYLDKLTRIDVLDTSTSTIVSTIWWNSNRGIYVPTPSFGNIRLLSDDLRATAANQVLLQTAIGAKTDSIATSDTGIFSVIAFIKRALQNWTTLLERLPILGVNTVDRSIPVTIASNQPNIPVTVTNSLAVDTTLLAKESTLSNVLNAIQGNINFNETIWTDDTQVYFARRTTQVGSTITVNYYLANGTAYTPGANARPVIGSGSGGSSVSDREIISNLYNCNASGTGYNVGDDILRSDVVDVNSLATIATFHFNTTTRQNIQAPTASHLNYITSEGYSTSALQTTLNTAIGSQTDIVAASDTGTFSVVSFVKRALQNWTSLLTRIPVLGQSTISGSVPVTLASNQPPISVTVTNPSGGTTGTASTEYTEGDIDTNITGTAMLWEDTADTLRTVSTTKPLPVTVIGSGGSTDVSALAKETGGNLAAINTTVGALTAPTTSLNNLFLDPALPASTISLLKAIAVSNRQLTINTQVWSSGTLYDPNNGFDKSFTVPNNVNYHILYGSVQAITTAAVGNRILKIEVVGFNNNVIFQTYAITYQAESKTYTYGLSNSESSLLPDQDYANLQIPVSLILYAGQKIRAVLIGGVTGDQVILSLQIGTR